MTPTTRARRHPLLALGLLALLALLVAALAPTPAGAQEAGPDLGAAPAAPGPWVVSVGDSYISGEGGRWAGNQSGPTTGNDALGDTAYHDNADGTGELINRCHRSRSAAIHIGGGVNSLNLACSGATTKTVFSNKDGNFKPGVDFAQDGSGRKGQAQMLQDFAASNDVRMVVLSIGGNDFNFQPIVEKCVKAFLTPALYFFTSYCSHDDSVTDNMSAANAAAMQDRIKGAIQNVQTAMHEAGVPDGSWTLVVNTYPQVLPYGADFRYPEHTYVRQTLGGCGIGNADVGWALNTALGTINRTVKGAVAAAQAARPTQAVTLLDTSPAFAQRGLCDEHVGRVGTAITPGFLSGVNDWREPGAADNSEWVTEINILNTWNYFTQESLHPNYWGQLALRNCVRQVWNDGNPAGGTCTRGTGVNANGEPNMTVTGQMVNPRPQASPDRFTVTGATAHVQPAPGVLAGDVDHPEVLTTRVLPAGTSAAAFSVAAEPTAEGDTLPLPEGALSAELVSGTTHGELHLAADGAFHYDPHDGFVGTDSFTYVVHDHYGTSEVATVTLEVDASVAVDPGQAPPAATPATVTPRFTG